MIIRVLNILLGLILILSSLINLNNILKFKKDKTTSWWIYLSLIIVIFILGILIIVDPLWLTRIIIRLAGASLIINVLITVILSKKVSKILMLEDKSTEIIHNK